jgi:hypothetical protein
MRRRSAAFVGAELVARIVTGCVRALRFAVSR